jgi:A/G-specific adenine glycosylase
MTKNENLWNEEVVQEFQKTFISWYEDEKRNLPWRQNKNPYQIWISEIMLQQTRVDTVIDYYHSFMEKYPTIESLANANDEELLKIWEGLGYYSRARNLKAAAIQIMTSFDGKMPDTLKEILTLKGIGPYTAGAILSIAYDLPEPAIDGNVFRVVSRLFEEDTDIAKSSARKTFDAILRPLMPSHGSGEMNQAFMDLGSKICTPTSPDCEECPLNGFCLAYTHDTQENFPVKTKKLKPKDVYYFVYAEENILGEYHFIKRDSKGLLSDMWTFPMKEVSKADYDAITENNYLGEATHIFSHLKWHMKLFLIEKEETLVAETDDSKEKYLTPEQFDSVVLPGPQQKLNKILANKHNFLRK